LNQQQKQFYGPMQGRPTKAPCNFSKIKKKNIMATAKKTVGKKTAPVEEEESGTPVTAKVAKQLAEIYIEAETEEEAKEKLVAILAKGGINDVENDSLQDLIVMVAAFPAEEPTDEEEEAPAPVKKGVKGKKAPVVEEPEEEEAEEEATDEEEEEDVDAPPVKKVMTKAKAAKAKAAPAEEEEDIEELVDEVETKKLTTGTKAKPPKAAKKEKAESARAHKLLGRKWATLTDVEKAKALKPLKKFLPEAEYRIDYLQDSIICKYLGETNEHNIFKYHLLRLLDDGKLEGIFVTHRFKEPAEFTEYLPEDLTGLTLKKGESCSYIHPFHLDMVIELFSTTTFLKDSVDLATKVDGRMAANHKKLQTQMEGKDKGKAAPAPAAKGKKTPPPPVEEEEEEVETEEEEEAEEVVAPPKAAKKVTATTAKPAPVATKPAAKAAPAPVAAKKTGKK
jgi:hypothetical protein